MTSHQYPVEAGLPKRESETPSGNLAEHEAGPHKRESETPSGNLAESIVQDLPSGRLRDS